MKQETNMAPGKMFVVPDLPTEEIGSTREYTRYRVSVAEYVRFHADGFLIVRGLVPSEDVEELRRHSEDLMYGRISVPGMEPPPGAAPEEIERRYLRIHMLHRALEIHERFLLHPRVLDVLQALIGPDVMALQSMFFLKFPGGDGQGYHQDSYYIPTVPDTLCGAWLAIDRADEENGCLHFTVGTQNEPIYPMSGHEHTIHGDSLRDLQVVANVSHTDEEINTLSRVAVKYPRGEAAAIMDPGDVAFFGGHVLNRSHRNRSPDRFRRSFVGHFANARSFTLWGGDGGPANHLHILARGDTHLPYAVPRFGTPCAANAPGPRGAAADGSPIMIASMPEDDMMAVEPMSMKRHDPAGHDE